MIQSLTAYSPSGGRSGLSNYWVTDALPVAQTLFSFWKVHCLLLCFDRCCATDGGWPGGVIFQWDVGHYLWRSLDRLGCQCGLQTAGTWVGTPASLILDKTFISFLNQYSIMKATMDLTFGDLWSDGSWNFCTGKAAKEWDHETMLLWK